MPRPKVHDADSFEVRASTIHGAGLGLFARVPIGLEETIGYYTGEAVTARALPDSPHAGSDYLLYVSRNCIIDAVGPKAGYTRYINHSSERRNAFLVVSTRWKSARFEAIRPIAPGDEIFFDYGELYFGEH